MEQLQIVSNKSKAKPRYLNPSESKNFNPQDTCKRGTNQQTKHKSSVTMESELQTSFSSQNSSYLLETKATCYSYNSYNSSQICDSQQQRGIKACQQRQKYICMCKSKFVKKSTLLKHIKEKHSYSLLSKQYLQIRDHLSKYDMDEDEYLKQHAETIRLIQQSKHSQYPIPQEMVSRISQQYASQAQQRYCDFGLNHQAQTYKQLIHRKYCLSDQSIREFKKLTIKYIVDFKRYFHIFIKNISLSQLFLVFIFNFSNSICKSTNPFLNPSKMSQFQTILREFQKWINLNYQAVFKKYQLFYYHINIPSGVTYCQHERQWKIDILIQEYLESLKRKALEVLELRFANFVLICLRQFINLEDLSID